MDGGARRIRVAAVPTLVAPRGRASVKRRLDGLAVEGAFEQRVPKFRPHHLSVVAGGHRLNICMPPASKGARKLAAACVHVAAPLKAVVALPHCARSPPREQRRMTAIVQRHMFFEHRLTLLVLTKGVLDFACRLDRVEEAAAVEIATRRRLHGDGGVRPL